MTISTTLLVDGDIVAYRTACMKDEEGNPLTYQAATSKVDSWLSWLKEHLMADTLEVFLTGELNFRRSIYPAYKDNRDPGQRPPLLGDLKNYLKESYAAKSHEGLEADDLIGLATWKEHEDDQRIIVSIDKDFLQVPGLLFNPNKIDEGVKEITQFAADQYFYTQWLTGDSTDGYPGVPGVGPKKAEKIIKRSLDEAVKRGVDYHGVLQAAILKEYEFHSLAKEFALSQARVARILRPGEFDYTSNTPRLWGQHIE